MNKIKKKYILSLAGIFVLIITTASVSANEENVVGDVDEEPNLISPMNYTDEGSLIIAPLDKMENDTSTLDIVFLAGIIGFAGVIAALALVKER